MKNNNKSNYTIRFVRKSLTYICNHTNINNPEAVKTLIASMKVSDGYKKNLCTAYNTYCKAYGIQWNKPQYRQEAKHIHIPTKEKLEMIIASCGKTFATKLQLSMETGLRPIELCNLKVKDVDLEQRLVYPTTAKHGSARILKISQSLQKLIQEHIIRNNLNPTDQLFKGDATIYGNVFRHKRNKLAKKLQDPTIQQIRLYDFRHYFATMTYHRTRDILFTKQQMGHRKIETTLIYTQLLQSDKDENYTCKVAQNIQQATELIENGFEYVTEMDSIKIFRKRK